MILGKRKLLSSEQLKKISEHRYVASNSSLCDPVFDIWWNWTISKTPTWLAPNLMTIAGLLTNILTSLILVWYSPDARQIAPKWTYFLCAFGVFVYQTLDAMDGKQARRTGSATPFGELLDHCCDAVSIIFLIISLCIALQLGYHPEWMFILSLCGMALFYLPHWQAYLTGVMKFGRINVTEGQIIVIFVYLATGLFGSDIWNNKLFSNDFQLWHLLAICVGTAVLRTILDTVCFDENVIEIKHVNPFSPAIQFLTMLIPAIIVHKMTAQNLFYNHPILFVFAFGILSAKLSCKLIISYVSHSKVSYVDFTLLGPASLIINSYFNAPVPEYRVLWFFMILAFFDIINYNYRIWKEVCAYLKIEMFHIQPKEMSRSHSSEKRKQNKSL